MVAELGAWTIESGRTLTGLLGFDLSAAVGAALDTCYPAQLGPDALLGPKALFARVTPPCPGRLDARLGLEIARPGDLVITVGCGDVTKVAPRIVAELRARESRAGTPA